METGLSGMLPLEDDGAGAMTSGLLGRSPLEDEEEEGAGAGAMTIGESGRVPEELESAMSAVETSASIVSWRRLAVML